jgi:hypothetical protein
VESESGIELIVVLSGSSLVVGMEPSAICDMKISGETEDRSCDVCARRMLNTSCRVRM